MAKKIKTVLVDDESKSLQIIETLLLKYGTDFEVIGKASTGMDAIDLIHKLEPELVFLDITLPDCDGFYVFEQCKDVNFEVVFVTAHDNYAIRAFEMAAIHYLLKPVDHLEFQQALDRFRERQWNSTTLQRHQVLQETIQNKPKRIVLPSMSGLTFVELNEIIRCQAESNYTLFFLTDNRKVMVSKSLNFYENLLTDLQFCRVHNKHIINFNHLLRFVKGKGGTLVMDDQSEVEISESRKIAFLDRLKDHALGI
ncbi:MAG: response regulator transcription factor [Bacteroidales bacterium]|nr:response regulator transcription factor [Bacteroidales bacterium]